MAPYLADTKQDFINWIMGTMDFVQAVPVERREELVSDIIDQYVTLKPDALINGVYYAGWGRIEVCAKK